ncbi:MAG: hypothetical protein EOO06_02145 [Chitinophagaceae bacterium]|nr:MAG: hypothetical protein EOO06_02145 [Chitinophagaceae bacterium]
MHAPLSTKLKIREAARLRILDAPENFAKSLGGLPAGVTLGKAIQPFDQLHWFVRNRAELEKKLGNVMKLLKEGMVVWVYYPKKTSGIQTDLNRDKGWDALMAYEDKLNFISLISFDETWSVFGFRPATAADKKKAAAKPAREIFNWVDPATKTVRLPEALANAFAKNKPAASFFDSLSFTNKKEYIEWIVTAKQESTKADRLAGTLERLGKGWKNPRNL